MDDVWYLLKENDFLLTNEINIDFVCVLCKKILIDPRNGPCGCKFCKICIENYLKNNENICPGSTDECKEEYLNLIENINIDHFLKRKIAKLKLNCPIENCVFSDQIINMKQHLTVCKEIGIKCPYFENGCNFISLSGANVDKHCNMSKDKHLEFVLLRNESNKNIINLLNENKVELKQEIEKLKIENDTDKNKLKQNETSIDQLNNNYNKLKTENEIHTKQINDYKAKYENEIKLQDNLMKYFSDLIINQTEFVWKIEKFSELKKSVNTSNQSDKFFIFKDDIWMRLSMGYYSKYDRYTFYEYRLGCTASHRNNSLNDSCPLNCNISIAIVNKIGGYFIFSFEEKKAFNSSGINFEKEISINKIESEIISDCLIVRCMINLAL